MSLLKINIVLFGIGSIGSSLIHEIINNQLFLLKNNNIDLRIPIIANSTLAFFEKNGLKNNWEADFSKFSTPYNLEDIINYAKEQGFENLIAIDATKGTDFTKSYIELIQNGFDIVATNLTPNTLHHEFYLELRRNLKKFQTEYLFESYLSPGLDILNYIKEIQNSGDKITKVKGILLQSTSYIFGELEKENMQFSTLLSEAKKSGYTSNLIDNLTGIDIAKKLIVIARELGKKIELKDIYIESLLQEPLYQNISKTIFNKLIKNTSLSLETIKRNLKRDYVLRYIGEIDLRNNVYEVKLVAIPNESNLGRLEAGEKLVEIFTESNPEIPITLLAKNINEKQLVIKKLLIDILSIASLKNSFELAST